MPNIGLPELLMVLVIALVVFGPKRLPQMGRQLGQAIREFRTATTEIRSQIGVDDLADSVKDLTSGLSLTGDTQTAAAEPQGAAIGPPPAPAVEPAVAADAPVVTDEAVVAPDADAGADPLAAAEPAVADPVASAEPAGVETFGKLRRSTAAAAPTSAD